MFQNEIPPHPHRSKTRADWMFVIPSLLLATLFGLPIIALFIRSAGMDFFAYAFTPDALAALQLSLVTSLISLLITLILGTPLAFMLARWSFRGKSALELLIDLPIVLPPSVAGIALLIAFGRNGVFGSVLKLFGVQIPFTTMAVILAQTFVASPLYVRAARLGFESIDPQLEEAAYVEGADEVQLFQEVMLPLTGRALLSGAILMWTRAIGEFGATILFAGNLPSVTQTMPLAIYLGFERSLGVAIALSAELVIVSIVLLIISRHLEKRPS